MRLHRVLIWSSDAALGIFSDGSVLSLSENGDCFTHISADGENVIRQKTPFAIQEIRFKVERILDCVNRFVEHPYLCTECISESEKQNTFKNPCLLTQTRWQAHPKYISYHKIQNSNWILSSVCINSIDGYCSLELDPHAQSFQVTFPAQIMTSSNIGIRHRMSEGESEYRYINHQQKFSIRSFPSRWTIPLRIALLFYFRENGTNIAQDVLSNIPESLDPQGIASTDQNTLYTMNIPFSKPLSATYQGKTPDWPKISNSTHGIVTSDLNEGEISMRSVYSNVLEHDNEDQLYMEHLRDLTYRVCTPPNHASRSHSIEVTLTSVNSILVTCSSEKFVSIWHQDPIFLSSEEQKLLKIYNRDALPQRLSYSQSGWFSNYDLNEIVYNCLKMEQHISFKNKSTNSSHLKSTQISTELIDISEKLNVGIFKAYQDGRIRIVFNDRTILEMNPSKTQCKIISNSGVRVHISVSSPANYEFYIKEALKYHSFAFMSTTDRKYIWDQWNAIKENKKKLENSLFETRLQRALTGFQINSFEFSSYNDFSFSQESSGSENNLNHAKTLVKKNRRLINRFI